MYKTISVFFEVREEFDEIKRILSKVYHKDMTDNDIMIEMIKDFKPKVIEMDRKQKYELK